MQSKSDFEILLKRELAAHLPPIPTWNYMMSLKFPVMKFQRLLRKLEFVMAKPQTPLTKISIAVMKFRLQSQGVKLGFTIPPNVFGPGLSIAHWGTITVNPHAKVGANCRIHQNVTIGSSKGKSPQIGDNCFIGAGAVIVGGITLGNDVKIGANSVVTRSFPDGATLVGIPAVNVAKQAESELQAAVD